MIVVLLIYLKYLYITDVIVTQGITAINKMKLYHKKMYEQLSDGK